MGDEHLSTVPEKESDEFIKSSVEDLVSIPRESQAIFDHVCDLPSPPENPKDHFDTFSDYNDDCTSYGDVEYVEASLPHSDVDPLLEEFTDELTHIDPLPFGSDDDLFDCEADLGEIENLLNSNPNIELRNTHADENSLSCGDTSYVEGLPSELVSLEEENDEIDTEIKDESLRATLLNVSLLISKIEAFKEKPISSPIPIKDSDIFPMILYRNLKPSLLIIWERRLVAVPLLILKFLSPYMIHSPLRSSPVNSLTSYLRQSMIISTLI
jgi:hypothetical protein